jgi:hypothetical protein
MATPRSARHLYEIHVAPEIPLLSAVLPEGLIVELVRLRSFLESRLGRRRSHPCAPTKTAITFAIAHQLTFNALIGTPAPFRKQTLRLRKETSATGRLTLPGGAFAIGPRIMNFWRCIPQSFCASDCARDFGCELFPERPGLRSAHLQNRHL